MWIKDRDLNVKEVGIHELPYIPEFNQMCVELSQKLPGLRLVCRGVTDYKFPVSFQAYSASKDMYDTIDPIYSGLLVSKFGNVDEEYYDACPCALGGLDKDFDADVVGRPYWLFYENKVYAG